MVQHRCLSGRLVYFEYVVSKNMGLLVECNYDFIQPTAVCVFYFGVCVQITRNTTPAYRTPEMIDLYSNFPINEKQDIWVRLIIISFLFFLFSHFSYCEDIMVNPGTPGEVKIMELHHLMVSGEVLDPGGNQEDLVMLLSVQWFFFTEMTFISFHG